MTAAGTRVLDDWRAAWPESRILATESGFVTSFAAVSSSPELCRSLLRLLDSAEIPLQYFLAGPENAAGARLDMFESFAEIAKPMGRAHDIRVYHQRQDPRRFRRIGIQLLELIDGALPVFCRCVVLNQHHGDIVDFLRVGYTDQGARARLEQDRLIVEDPITHVVVTFLGRNIRSIPSLGEPGAQPPARFASRKFADDGRRLGDIGPFVRNFLHIFLAETMADKLPSAFQGRACNRFILLDDRAVYGQRSADVKAIQDVDKSPEPHAISVLMPCPVRDIRNWGTARWRSENGPRQRLVRIPVLDVNNHPYRKTRSAGQGKPRAVFDRRIWDPFMRQHNHSSAVCDTTDSEARDEAGKTRCIVCAQRFLCQGEKIYSHDPDPQVSYALDEPVQDITSLYGPDAGGSSSENQVARCQSEELRELGNDFRNLPDQGRKVGTLHALAIPFQPDRSLLRMADFARGRHGRARSRVVEGFSDVPRPGHFLSLQLKITPGNIKPRCISVWGARGVFDWNVRAGFVSRCDQLELL